MFLCSCSWFWLRKEKSLINEFLVDEIFLKQQGNMFSTMMNCCKILPVQCLLFDFDVSLDSSVSLVQLAMMLGKLNGYGWENNVVNLHNDNKIWWIMHDWKIDFKNLFWCDFCFTTTKWWNFLQKWMIVNQYRYRVFYYWKTWCFWKSSESPSLFSIPFW